jgi:hypothetical protein
VCESPSQRQHRWLVGVLSRGRYVTLRFILYGVRLGHGPNQPERTRERHIAAPISDCFSSRPQRHVCHVHSEVTKPRPGRRLDASSSARPVPDANRMTGSLGASPGSRSNYRIVATPNHYPAQLITGSFVHRSHSPRLPVFRRQACPSNLGAGLPALWTAVK